MRLFTLMIPILSFLSLVLASTSPTVTVKNGTLRGLYSAEWDQDFFLGIPFAQPPLGPLRFKWPQTINSSYNGTRDATQYGYSCYQYGSNFNLSENCLTLNGKLHSPPQHNLNNLTCDQSSAHLATKTKPSPSFSGSTAEASTPAPAPTRSTISQASSKRPPTHGRHLSASPSTTV
jgi:hypothetical protein